MHALKHQAVELSPDVLFQEVEGEAVLLDLSSGQYFGLNEVGTRFWEVAQETTAMDEIVGRLLAEFEVDPGTLEGDLAEFLDQMIAAGLLRLVDPPEAE